MSEKSLFDGTEFELPIDEDVLDYYSDTDPDEFVRDLRAILSDGDNMTPEALIRDIAYMCKRYLEAHEEEWRGGGR